MTARPVLPRGEAFAVITGLSVLAWAVVILVAYCIFAIALAMAADNSKPAQGGGRSQVVTWHKGNPQPSQPVAKRTPAFGEFPMTCPQQTRMTAKDGCQ